MYTFEVVATDSKGLTASDKLEISVMQHKQSRAVNHEFHIYLKIEKWSKFPTNVDWELKVSWTVFIVFVTKNVIVQAITHVK